MPMSRLGPSTAAPRSVTLPPERGKGPARILSSVVLPQPDWPTIVTNSPVATSSEIPASACTRVRALVAYVFSRSETAISGAVTNASRECIIARAHRRGDLMKSFQWWSVVVVASLVAASTLAPAHAQAPVRVGSKNFTEQFVLGEIYAQALDAAGIKTEKKL